MSSVPTLGYWDTRSLGEPIRTLLHYVGVPFNDKRYQFGQGTSFADMDKIKEPWRIVKNTLGLDFPDLPYYIEGDLKLTQSLTIIRYLARKHGLMAKDERTLARQEMLEQQLKDMETDLAQLYYDKDYEQKKQAYIKEILVPQLEGLARFLGSNEWLTKDLSYIDIIGYEILHKIKLFVPEIVGNYPNLVQFLTRFENLKPIKEYQSSPKFKNWPFSAPYAHWGFKK